MDIIEKPIPRDLFRHLLLILAYVVTARFILAFFDANGAVSIIWPSSGIALAALLLGGKKYWISIFVAAMANNLLSGHDMPMALLITIGNVLEAYVAALILWKSARFDRYLTHARDYILLTFAGALASVLAAMLGVFTLWLSGYLPVEKLANSCLHWWQGDVLGIVLITPLILIWKTLPVGWLTRTRILETVSLFALTVMAGQIIFMGWLSPFIPAIAQSYWMFLFVAWASVRFGRHGVLMVITITAIQALLGALYEDSIERVVTDAQLQNFWCYILILTIVGLTLALVIHQRKRDQQTLLELKEDAELALKKLHESEDRHRILFEYSKDALMTSEPPLSTFTAGNREAFALFGVESASEFMKLGPMDVSPEFQPDGRKSIDKIVEVVNQAIANGSSFFEWTYKRINGEEFPCSVLLTAVTINDKPLIQAAVRDITAQKQSEKTWLELNEELEERVRERTEELARAKKIAEKATQEKSEFLANMSHEIRTPISSVLGMSYLALNTGLNAKQRDYVEKIQLSAQHLLGLIDSVLDFSKLEAGQVVLENIDFNLDQIVDTLNTVVLERAAHKGLKVIVEIDGVVNRNLHGDPLRLTQILINYVNNAIKFSEQGDIVVRVRVVESSSRDYVLRFEVQDQGVGISLDEQQHIFESFRQGQVSTARKYGGSGLGLAISKQLAEMMGGEVGVSSQPGQGSRFWFTARVGKSNGLNVRSLPEKYSDTPAASEYRLTMSGLHILLAEDNEINQQVATELLELAGATVTVVENGKEALEVLRNGHFDCVLMDVQMPEMNGIEATLQIRADAALANNIVIAMTANAWAEDQHKCLDAGMNDFISKPVKPAHLYAVIARWMNRSVLPGHNNTLQDQARHLAEKKPDLGPLDHTLNDPAIIDLRILAESLGDDIDQLRDFIATRFVESTQKGINEMRVALNVEDIEMLKILGHKFKSSAKTVGAMGFSELCQDLEKLPEFDFYPDAKLIIERMQALLLQIANAVKV